MIIGFTKVFFNKLAAQVIHFKKTVFNNNETEYFDPYRSDELLFDDGSGILFDNNQSVLS